MKREYCLRIHCPNRSVAEQLDCIFGVKGSASDGHWEYVLTEGQGDAHVDFSDVFTTMLRNTWGRVAELGVSRDDIEVWMYYEYSSQCNMEFSPSEMKRPADAGLTFCVSCWEEAGD
jgi:hypothetical protein